MGLVLLAAGWIVGLLTAWWWDDRCDRQIEAEERLRACGKAPARGTESLEPVIPRSSDQQPPPAAAGGLTGNSGYVDLSGEIIRSEGGRPVCTCTLIHRCAACRDGLVQGFGAFTRRGEP